MWVRTLNTAQALNSTDAIPTRKTVTAGFPSPIKKFSKTGEQYAIPHPPDPNVVKWPYLKFNARPLENKGLLHQHKDNRGGMKPRILIADDEPQLHAASALGDKLRGQVFELILLPE
ncbi:MAG: hypothetical protein U5J78_07820 [Parasphingorhabdus sp.]|nr:hypothetical protein [Parasphingorhabdus sp.]